MSEQTGSEPSLGAFLFIMGWALLGLLGSFGMTGLDVEQQVLVMPLAYEWLIILMTFVFVADPSTEDGKLEQRSGEANARYALRVWISLHVLLFKAPFIGIARAPGAARRAVAWLRSTPGGDGDA